MAWTTPKTFTAGSVLTASELNTHLRDNLLETSAAVVTAAGDLSYADAANSMGNRLAIGAANTFLVSTGSAPVWRAAGAVENNSSTFTFTNSGYLDLDAVTGGTAGSACSVTATTGTRALVMWRANFSNDTANTVNYVSYRVSGATTQTADNDRSLSHESSGTNNLMAAASFDFVALTAGVNTFELQAACSGGTAAVNRTELFVMSF